MISANHMLILTATTVKKGGSCFASVYVIAAFTVHVFVLILM